VGTDRTEASTFFTEVKSQTYSDDALEIFGLKAIKHALPEVAGSAELVGRVTAEAAQMSGLAEGTPVAAGLHDVTASALGIGAHKHGVLAAVAGTYSINEVVSAEPRTGEGWLCRNAIEPQMWNNMAISPASSANYEWFLESLCQEEAKQAAATGQSIHDVLAVEIKKALNKPSSLLFHPFLFGSPFGADASAAFLGLRGWHDRGTMLRSVLEGIIFNHRVHVDALRTAFTFNRVMLTGGISRNPVFAQIFADATGLVVQTSETSEAASWGAALCAGAATRLYQSPQHDPRDLDAISTSFQPDLAKSEKLEKRYQVFCEAAAAMAPLWPKLEQLAEEGHNLS
jgi:L-xylulokinase